MQSWPVEYRDGDGDLGPTGAPPGPAPDNADVGLGCDLAIPFRW